jgi:hypothetical protein
LEIVLSKLKLPVSTVFSGDLTISEDSERSKGDPDKVLAVVVIPKISESAVLFGERNMCFGVESGSRE